MKKELRLLPLIGFEVDSKKITFGQSADEIKQLLGKPDYADEKQLFYDNLEIRLDFNKNKFEYAEVQGPYCEFIIPNIYDINPFEPEAEKLYELLEKNNNGKIDDSESPYCYCFVEISVGVWRESTPHDIAETIAQVKKDGEYDEVKEVFDNELDKSKYFWTVGIGAKGYYKVL